MKKEFNNLAGVLQRAGAKGMTVHELSGLLHVKRQHREAFYRALREAVRTGKVVEKKGRFRCAERPGELVDARIVSVKEGFGFASADDGGPDLFVPGRYLQGALPGDRVRLRRRPGRGELQEGEVVRITEENARPFSGTYQKRGGASEILPDRGSRVPVRVAPSDAAGARDGDKVLARITRRGDRHDEHRAAITSVFGRGNSAAACCEAILAAEGITREFPEEVLLCAVRIESQGIPADALAGRRDLRDWPIFTIDGADTKDIDDAVSLERLGDGWRLGVHIADVSHYVGSGSALDREAFERGTSVYFADSVVPMLPPALSNGICSLNPDEDRLAFSALLDLSPEGEIMRYEFCKTVIRSRLKGVYTEINALLDGTAEPETAAKYDCLRETLGAMRELAGRLSARRAARGGLDLSSPESKVTVGEDGRAVSVYARTSGVSEGMIEEFMLAANEAAADYALRRELPFVYRIHEPPSLERIETLCGLLDRLGLDASALKRGCTSGTLTAALRQARDAGQELVVNNQILRAMAKARYSEANQGHFGLTLEHYAHFTSPIRRYPDLAIHRIMSESLAGAESERLVVRYGAFAASAAAQSSARELRAMTVERACEDCYKAEYMAGHIGECFDGVIASVTARGLYVALPSTVDGFIRLENLPGGHYDCDNNLELIEIGSNRRYRVGDPMRVTVAGADVSAGRVDFVPAEESREKRGGNE